MTERTDAPLDKELDDLLDHLSYSMEPLSRCCGTKDEESLYRERDVIKAKIKALLATTPNGTVEILMEELALMGADHIVKGSPGPLYSAGWAAACEHWAKRLLQRSRESLQAPSELQNKVRP